MPSPSRVAAVLVLVLGGLSVLSCGGGFGGLGKAACPQLQPNVDALSAGFSADFRANGKIRTFVQAAKDIATVSLQIEAEIADACTRMGTDLGLHPQWMQAKQGPGGRAQGACEALAKQIDSILRGGVQVRVGFAPPQCQADVSAEARCQGACEVAVDPGQIVASCEPARLSGYCQGRCVGRCEGRCMGQCNGQCSQLDAQGRCVGACQGDCYGGCDATCHARCEGQWQSPRCEGQVRPPSADAECNANCRAHVNARATCTPPQVQVQVSQGSEMAARLAGTLQANMPQLLHAQVALARRLGGDVQTVVQMGRHLPNVIGQAGLQAMACVAAAADASVEASMRIQVSVQASASVSGRVGAGG
jgi:hypothetical protein